MSKIIIIVACLIAVTAGTVRIEDFLGEWVPIAIFTDRRHAPPDTEICFRMTFAKGSGNLQCTDGRKFEPIDTRPSNETRVNSVGVLPVEDVSIVTPPFKVICTNEGKDIDALLVAKLINKDYALLHSLSEEKTIWIYRRNAPTLAELTTFVNSRDELRGKPFIIFCTSD